MGNKVSSLKKSSKQKPPPKPPSVPNSEYQKMADGYRNMKGTKRALLCGCNYPKTAAELKGCVNDVWNWYGLLTDCFGFSKEEVTILIDDNNKGGKYEKPTGKHIKDNLKRLVEVSKPGDVIFFQFSGHGVQVPADEDDDDYEPDGLDEALCPTDMNLIVDDDLRAILNPLDEGVKFTMVSDCCHSGSMLDHKEVIIDGEADEDVNAYSDPHKAREIFLEDLHVEASKAEDFEKKNRAIDLGTMEEILKEIAQEQTSGSEKIEVQSHKARSTIYKLYGDDASNAVASKVEPKKDSHYVGAGKKPESGLTKEDKGILITGCQAHETSADVTGKDGRAFGALSHTITKIIRRHKDKHGERPITSRQVVLKVRKLLYNSGFLQNPCLECSDNNADANFIVW